MNLARSLGLIVTAEGVETERQVAELDACGCTRAQGFYSARPQPADELGALLDRDTLRARLDRVG